MMQRLIVSIMVVALTQLLYAADNSLSVRRNFWNTQLNDRTLPSESRIRYADSIISSYNGMAPLRFYNIKSNLLYESGRFADMLKVFDSALKICPADSVKIRLNIMFQRGLAKFTLTDMSGSLKDAYAIMEESRRESMPDMTVKATLLVNDILRQAELYAIAQEYVGQLDSVVPRIADPERRKSLQTVVFHMAANNYLDMGRIDDCMNILKKVDRRNMDSPSVLMDYILDGMAAHKIKQYEIAEEYFSKAYNLHVKNYNHNSALVGLLEMKVRNGRLSEAKDLMRKNAGLLDSLRNTVLRADLFHLDYVIAREEGNWREALEALEACMETRDSIGQTVKQSDVYAQILNFEKADLNGKVKSYRHAAGRRLTWIWCLGGGVILLAVALAVVCFAGRKRNVSRRNRQPTSESSSVVASLSQRISKLSQILDETESVLRDSNAADDEKVSKIQQLIISSEHSRDTESSFDDIFSASHEEFYKRLYQLCPSLTTAEVKMCAYIKAGMSAKEIADATNRSVRTVETIKYNLRKKLGIEGSTESWLARLHI